MTSKCDDVFSECYGSGYKNASFGGACGDYIACVTACDCNDMTCVQKCPLPGEACQTCVEKLSTCMQQCPEPECMKGGDGSGDGDSCTDLADCCAAKEDADERETCEKALELANGNDISCGAIYDAQCQ